jgi:hypothetical protein
VSVSNDSYGASNGSDDDCKSTGDYDIIGDGDSNGNGSKRDLNMRKMHCQQ